ncbi:hypothetical protein [Streptomyces sp. NPDC054797]
MDRMAPVRAADLGESCQEDACRAEGRRIRHPTNIGAARLLLLSGIGILRRATGMMVIIRILGEGRYDVSRDHFDRPFRKRPSGGEICPPPDQDAR